MKNPYLVSLTGAKRAGKSPQVGGKILLVKPPYFSPWTPPLGIALIKAFLEQRGYSVKCLDLNTDPELWGMHHKYFAALQKLEDVTINDGYSKLWWILNAHTLAYLNSEDPDVCATVLESIIPLYGTRCNRKVVKSLLPLVEGFFVRLQELIRRMDLSEFSLVGTSTYSTSLAASFYFLREIKRINPRITTVMGGGVFADDLALGSDNLETLLREYAFVDHVILGEGEILLLKLLEGEFSGKRMISLADLQGASLAMPDIPLPDFSDVDLEHYYHLTIEGARSCPFQCSFCSETVQWGEYRKKPMNLFAQQAIELAERHHNNSFFMGDSLMNPYIMQFSQELLARRANILYDGYLRADKPVTYRHNVKQWARSGCYRVRLGIESAAARVLEAMNKKTTPKVISDVLKTLATAGIRTTTYWIVGFPGETEEDFQESCDFISEHHRYIYELEAHPYYYYPYGQVGSRLHRCYSIYPDWVTDIIKFKVWDIIQASPTREERYDRLRRVSRLASKLRLPNIYSMSERFQAEERWSQLHPLAIEVYKGTQVRRPEAQRNDRRVKLLPGARRWLSGLTGSAAPAVLCYQASVKKALQDDLLAGVTAQLVRYNGLLVAGQEGAQYISRPSIGDLSRNILSIYDIGESTGGEIERVKRLVIEEVSKELRTEPGRSAHIAVLKSAENAEILLLAHRAIVDSKSALLLLEDFFRLYEQLSNNLPISLRPAPKSYADLTVGLADRPDYPPEVPIDGDARPAGSMVDGEVALTTEKDLTTRLGFDTLLGLDLKPAELFTLALLSSLAKLGATENDRVDTAYDSRISDSSIEFTVGPLTCLCGLTPALIDSDSLPASIRQLRRAWENGRESISHDFPPRGKILLNLEYLVAEPWPGNDEWTPQGFVANGSEFRENYDLQIVPVISRDEIRISLRYLETGDVERLVEGLIRGLIPEIESLLDYSRQYADARSFWLEEFTREVVQTNLELDFDVELDAEEGRDWVRLEIERAIVTRLEAKCQIGTSIALLAAYSSLLSRMNGQEEVTILSWMRDHEDMKAAPLRLYPYWNLSFREFTQKVAQKVELVVRNSTHALDIMIERDDSPSVFDTVFDVGYLFTGRSETPRALKMLDDLSTYFAPGRAGVDLVLQVSANEEELMLQVGYEKSRCSKGLATKLVAYLKAILAEAAGVPDILIGDIRLDDDLYAGSEVDSVVQATFHF